MSPWVERNTQKEEVKERNGQSEDIPFQKTKLTDFDFLTSLFQVHKAPSYTIVAIHSSPGLHLNLKLTKAKNLQLYFREYNSRLRPIADDVLVSSAHLLLCF